ncbi:MAG TPA: PP2C family protein-serine/threonine phosphatase [Candidatus Saccharimonadales bacterium]|nr:PP2C family protein-serine/threonine phosphatase [Candidatus Saccharimonadales bacterium]
MVPDPATTETAEAPRIGDLERVVAPLIASRDHLDLVIQDRDGRPLAGTAPDGPPPDAVAREVPDGPFAGHRIVGWGPAMGTELGTAVVEALAAALAASGGPDPEAAARASATAHRLEEELAHGRRLQRSFVPLHPPDVPGYDVASHYEAAREVGGDFFDLFRLRRRGRPLSVVIADVTGKGIAAALLMAFSRPLLHAAIDHTSGPASALERTNRILVEERRSSLFITALCARLDLRTGHLCVANAGHEPPVLVRADGSPIECLLGSGPLIGAFRDLAIPEVGADLAPGDLVLLYTDGVTDARSPAGERFDEWRLFGSVERVRGGTAAEVVAAVAGDVATFQGSEEPADDITIVAIRRLPAA